MLRKTFVVFKNFIFRNYREEVLGNIISGKISKLKIIKKKKELKIKNTINGTGLSLIVQKYNLYQY